MLNPNHCVLGLEIFTKHSQGSFLEGLLRTFGDISDTLDVIQVALSALEYAVYIHTKWGHD